jgi:DNA-binding transcriptional regulator YdaS (Cro superfamily)
MSTAKTALRKAIDRAGGQTALASKIGVRQSLISFWLNQAKEGVAPDKALAIEQAAGVPRYELRPDVFARPASRPPKSRGGSGLAHFSRYKFIRRNRFKSAEDVERHIQSLREEWADR